MTELSAVPYHKCFLAERGKNLNCRVEDGHKNDTVVDKNNITLTITVKKEWIVKFAAMIFIDFGCEC
jgi:hypothetical protein